VFTEAFDEMMVKNTDKMVAQWEAVGMTEQQIEQTLEQWKFMFSPLIQALFGFLATLLFGFLLSLIVAAFVRIKDGAPATV
jgi:hypothetical protein